MAGAAPQVMRNKGSIGSKDLHLENFSVSNGGAELIEVSRHNFMLHVVHKLLLYCVMIRKLPTVVIPLVMCTSCCTLFQVFALVNPTGPFGLNPLLLFFFPLPCSQSTA